MKAVMLAMVLALSACGHSEWTYEAPIVEQSDRLAAQMQQQLDANRAWDKAHCGNGTCAYSGKVSIRREQT